VRLTPWEEDRLLIFSAAELARRHRAAGLRLNAPEAIALICDAMLESARAGRSYAEVEAAGLAAVGPADVIPGVRELVDDVRLEVLLEDGARLIVLVDPLGAGLPPGTDGPGAVVPTLDSMEEAGHAPAALERIELPVRNTSARVVRVSSHFPFGRVNPRLEFDRAAAAGFRLDLPAGSSERWSPDEAKTVALVRYAATGITDGKASPAGNRSHAGNRSRASDRPGGGAT
jgi:urease subunit gamma/beta